MSEMEPSGSSSLKGKGVVRGLHPPQQQQQQAQQQPDLDFMSFQGQQEFTSWRNPPPHHAGDYNNFYYSGPAAAAAAAAGGYSPFSPGDIRDSIAAIWSRTSPSGEGVPMGGAYGQFPPPPPPPPHPDGQFNHHLGHFTPHGDMNGLFPEQYGGFPYGYGYTQWPTENGRGNGGGGSSYLEQTNSRNPPAHNNNNELIMSQLMENTKMSSSGGGNKPGKQVLLEHATNGYPLGGPGNMAPPPSNKKMSWAKVASQPAKPVGNASSSSKSKKPGVLSPPAMLPLASSKQQQQGGGDTGHVYVPSSSHSPVHHLGGEVPMSNGKPAGGRGGGVPNYGPRGHRGKETLQQQQHHGPPPVAAAASNGPRSASTTGLGTPSESHPVLESLRSANEYNPKNFDLNPVNARYFVLKSFCEDDIHRSIKFEIWCSTQHGNKRLDTAWNEQVGVGPVYLFFSVNGSGHFCGMAQMLTGVDYSSTNSVWVQDKFKGQFKVKWIYVKDVPNNQLRHILLENNENKPVTKSRDTQEVPSEKGQMLLKVLHGYKHSTCIFDDFAHYERRQEVEESKKNERQQQQQQHHHDKSHEKNRDNSARESRNSKNHNSNNNGSSPWEWEIKEMNGASAPTNWE